MAVPEPYATVGRLLVAIAVMIAPTLLFLGLVRGLERLRDDDLVDEWLRTRGDERAVADLDDALGAVASGASFEPDRSSVMACPVCGATNRADVAYCRECLTRLS
ncbi:DUF7577 domain-containing protein [Halopiger djelfimassiliensis]|uniref:DUF7577 domain-containing protein n=1 Tax=Halopiger djelfimassiliensis TaxID=1293047 RepID=UPI000677ABE9|nr:hypothetical protein [Halopiger djelfimassiliensis]